MVLFEFGGDDLMFESAHSGVINVMTPGSNVDGKFKKVDLIDIFVSSFKRSKSQQ